MAGVGSMAVGGAVDPCSSLSFRSPVVAPRKVLNLHSSFLPRFNCRRHRISSVVVRNKDRTRRRGAVVVIVNEVAGQYEESFEDVQKDEGVTDPGIFCSEPTPCYVELRTPNVAPSDKQIINYFTYKATRTVLYQLYEMNPPKYKWFYNFLATNNPMDGKRFLRHLGKEKQDLAERVMITRLHLYGQWIKKCDHAKMYEQISEQNLELMRERLMETVIWPSDDTNTEKMAE